MIYLILSIVFMILLAVITRKAADYCCSAIQINTISRYVSGGIMLLFVLVTVNWEDLGSAISESWLAGCVGALFMTMSTVGATKSVQHGPLGISWTVLRCSMVISTLASLFYWREIPTGLNRSFILCMTGIILTVSSVVIFGIAKTRRNHSGHKLSGKWFLFALMAFFGQGLWEICIRATRSASVEGFRGVFIAFVFIISAFITTPAVVKIKREKLPIELLIGTLFGICGIFASGLRVWALSEVDGTIVFPATTITVTVAVQLMGITIFGERPEKVDIFGYLTALAGIVCLACM